MHKRSENIKELKQILFDNFYDPNSGNGSNPLVCTRCQTEYEISLKEHEVYGEQIYRLCKKCYGDRVYPCDSFAIWFKH